MTVPTRSGDHVCRGCEAIVAGEVAGTLWCRSPFGLTTLRVHKTQECARAALAATGYKLYPGNRPPGSDAR